MADLTPPAAPHRLDDLAGALAVRPGQACPGNLQSTRREWAPVLSRGRPAAALPGLLSSVYALCGGAHRWAAAAAVAAAQGTPAEPTSADRALLRADTLREHLRRLWLDWPRALAMPGGAPEPAALAACPLVQATRSIQHPRAVQDPRAGPDLLAGRAWVERMLLGQQVAAWWAGWRRDGTGFARDWAGSASTPVASWLHAADVVLGDAAVPCQPLAAVADGMPAATMRGLAARLRVEPCLPPGAGPGYALQPVWQGLPCETGPWARWADLAPDGLLHGLCVGAPPHPAEAVAPALPVFHRLAARLAEVAGLLSDEGEQRLALGALALGPGEGIAWCEMARGLLVHWVRLSPEPGADGRPVVDCCRVLAPTEWNFHPAGALAQALARSHADLPDATVRLMAAAFDPCVALSIVRPDPLAAVAAPAPVPPPDPPPSRGTEDPQCTR